MDSHLVKSLNVDRRSRKRLRFATTKQKSKLASADVYRRYKRRLGATAAATREENVHHTTPSSKKQCLKTNKTQQGELMNVDLSNCGLSVMEHDSVNVVADETTLAEELDLALERNGSAVFKEFYHKVWPLVRSLPELVHHAEKIVDLMLEYLLSPENVPPQPAKDAEDEDDTSMSKDPSGGGCSRRRRFEVNHATTDILHLLAVISRDLRHEVHPWVHKCILPRLVNDLLNPPLPGSGKQPVPLDVPVVEAAFRTMAYIFRYDAEKLLEETTTTTAKKEGAEQACLEPMRKYYGATLAHKRELIRRLSAETFAPLIRRLRSASSKRRHLRRVLRALDASSSEKNALQDTPQPTATTNVQGIDQPTQFQRFQRISHDAVDGVAQLCLELAKGASGDLHSKGSFAVDCVLSFVVGVDGNDGQTLLLSREVASSFFRRLVTGLKPEHAATVLVALKDQILSLLKKENDGRSSERFTSSVNFLLRLASEVMSYEKGSEMDVGKESVMCIIQEISNCIVENSNVAMDFEEAVAKLLCVSLPTYQHDQHMQSFLHGIMALLLGRSSSIDKQKGTMGTTNMSHLTKFRALLARRVFSGMPSDLLALGEVAPLVFETALASTSNENDEFFSLVHGVASFRGGSDKAGIVDDDDTFFPKNAYLCKVNPALVSALLDRILLPFDKDMLSSNVQNFSVAAKCAAFVAACPADQTCFGRSFKKAAQWLSKLVSLCSIESFQLQMPDSTLLLSSLIEALALLSSVALDRALTVEVVEPYLMHVRGPCENFLAQNPSSICTLKACSSYCRVLQRLSSHLCDDANAIFKALTPNLYDMVHFKRLYTLQILATFPKKPFVVDHAALDLTDDIEEEPSSVKTGNNNSKGPVGACPLLDLLLEVESLPIVFDSERMGISTLARIEVLGRNGRLPTLYVDVAVCHLMGLLHLKFSPVWKPAIKALGAVVRAHGQFSWPFVFNRLSRLTAANGPKGIELERDEGAAEGPHPDGFKLQLHYSALRLWESSGGLRPTLFARSIRAANEAGKVSMFESRGTCEALLSLWELLENDPVLIVAHSRDIVPLVLEYFRHQYFTPDDPDGKEIFMAENNVRSVVEENGEASYTRGDGRQLLAILKAFAVVKGPEQLVSHRKLNQIFLALLGHGEKEIVKTAIECLLRFKPDFIVPYVDRLKVLASDKLREAMLGLKESAHTGKISTSHRIKLVPVLARILYGRMSSKSGARTSKDSPSSRRTSVFSFVSGFCATDEELFPFVYLALRRYLKGKATRKPVEELNDEDRQNFHSEVVSVSCDECKLLPPTVHEGFLNVLEAIISQLGHRVASFVPCFVSVVLALLEMYPVKVRGDYDSLAEEGGVTLSMTERANRVRSLCYLRLAEMFEKYSQSFNYSCYGQRMWKCLDKPLELLPEQAKNQEKVPSLLQMLVVLSRNPGVRTLLRNHETALKAGFLCLARSHGDLVVEAVLTLIGNFIEMAEEEGGDSTGLLKLLPDLLRQFELRFERFSSSSRSWKRELFILSEICRLKRKTDNQDNQMESDDFDSLAMLLVPFLRFNSKASEKNRLNILDVLESIIPNMTGSSAETLYSKLSLLLGPFKATAGFTSLLLRCQMATCLEITGKHHLVEAREICAVIKNLSAMDKKTVNEMDADSVLASLKQLSDRQSEMSWSGLIKKAHFRRVLISPVIRTCFHFLFSEDGVVARASFYALKVLIGCSQEICEDAALSLNDSTESWEKLVEQSIVPLIRSGVCCKEQSSRRFFILLVAEVAKVCGSTQSPHLFGDLRILQSKDEPDLDFFLNITHVQIHRRTRALNRIRKQLLADDSEEGMFSLQSLAGILFPIILHPIYESKTKLEEPLAMEAIATIGAISRRLPWKKFHDELWTLLVQINRQNEQERYIIGAICAFLSGFHFDVGDPYQTLNEGKGSVVWKALDTRVIPRIEELFTKEKTGKKGEKIGVVRPQVILGLSELYRNLPDGVLQRKLPRLITVLSDALKCHDSSSRDMARSTLAKLAVDVGPAFLPDILRELAVTLKEGYQLHVRAAAVHSILLQTWEARFSPETCTACEEKVSIDGSVPALMDLIQQDIFGSAQERRDAEFSQVRYVKEAGGSKSLHSIELIALMINIDTEASRSSEANMPCGSVYCLVSPLLNRILLENQSLKQLRQVKECLARVVQGLSKNRNFSSDAILPLVYSTIEPCIRQDSSGDNDGTVDLTAADKNRGAVVEWRPSHAGMSGTAVGAREEKILSERSQRKVADGSDAPKLTGSWRRNTLITSTNSLDDPTSAVAVLFGLQLLRYALRNKSRSNDSRQLDPFVPLLTECICRYRDSEAILLAMRCLGDIRSAESNLPSFDLSSKVLASKTLELLVGFGGNEEMLQASFKMMTYLMEVPRSSETMALNEEQMELLLSFVQTSLANAAQHNPAMSLMRALVARRVISPGMYDLMEAVAKMAIQSHKETLRKQASDIYIRFLISYPISAERMVKELKQLIVNIQFDGVEGRHAAISMVASVIAKFPDPVIAEQSKLFFLPLTMQLVNDESEKGRRAVSECISTLLSRLSTDLLQSLFDYAVAWGSSSDHRLRRASLSVLGLFVDSCGVFLNVDVNLNEIIRLALDSLDKSTDWELVYCALLLVEKANAKWPGTIAGIRLLWLKIVDCLSGLHPWVNLVSLRLVWQHLQSMDPSSFVQDKTETFLQQPGNLFKVTHALCSFLDCGDEELNDDALAFVVKGLTFSLKASTQFPQLCFAVQDDGHEASHGNPVKWLLTRLSQIAKPKGPKRRQAVFKCFAAFAKYGDSVVFDHLELMIEPLHRVERETKNEIENVPQRAVDIASEEAQVALDVLHLLEQHCSPYDKFVDAYGAVKQRAHETKMKRSEDTKAEAARDLRVAAQKKVDKQIREKERRKRRVSERAEFRERKFRRKHS